MAISVKVQSQNMYRVRTVAIGASSSTDGISFNQANSAYNAANVAYEHANAAYAQANTGGGGGPAFTRYEFTATEGQTSFTGLSYSIGYVDVYINGARIATTDFTANTGNSVILTTPAAVNDIVEIVGWSTVTLSALNLSSGPITLGYSEVSNDYIINADTDYSIKCLANSFTVTLPTAANNRGQMFVVKNSNSANSGNNINVTTTSSQTIDDVAPPVIIGPRSSLTFISDNTNWMIV